MFSSSVEVGEIKELLDKVEIKEHLKVKELLDKVKIKRRVKVKNLLNKAETRNT